MRSYSGSLDCSNIFCFRLRKSRNSHTIRARTVKGIATPIATFAPIGNVEVEEEEDGAAAAVFVELDGTVYVRGGADGIPVAAIIAVGSAFSSVVEVGTGMAYIVARGTPELAMLMVMDNDERDKKRRRQKRTYLTPPKSFKASLG